MMKKVIKLIGIIIMFFIIINIFEMNSTKSYATKDNLPTLPSDLSESGMSDISENPDAWTPSVGGTTSLDDKVGVIASLVRTVGIIVSVGTLSVIGIKFMLGSVEEKAQYKQTMMPWVIGAIMIFAMTTIPTLLYDMSKGMFEESGITETQDKDEPDNGAHKVN